MDVRMEVRSPQEVLQEGRLFKVVEIQGVDMVLEAVGISAVDTIQAHIAVVVAVAVTLAC